MRSGDDLHAQVTGALQLSKGTRYSAVVRHFPAGFSSRRDQVWQPRFFRRFVRRRNHQRFFSVVSMKPKHYEGGCICGHIRFRVTGEPGRPHTCSCESCRKHSGSLTLTWVEFPAQSVEWIGPGGKPSAWRSSSYSCRAFCSACGSTIGAIDDEQTVAIATGALDKPNLKEFAPRHHSYTSRRPRWWHVKSDHESGGES